MRVLIVDDHELVRRGVRSLLQSRHGFDVCGEAVDGEDAVAKARLLKPDVITMDISMPKMNGLDATREIRRILPQTQVLVLSQHDAPEMIKQVLKAGASGYVVKSSISNELVGALSRLSAGEMAFDSVVRLPESGTAMDLKEILQRTAAYEKALRESEERLRLAQQVARIGTFELNLKTGVNRWTPELEAMHGLTPGGFKGTQAAWEELVHPADREEILQKVKQAINTREVFEGEWRIVWPDKSVRWILGRAWVFSGEEGAPERFLGVNIDVTERKLAEEASLESQSQLALALKSSNTALFEWDLVNRRGKWNAQMTAIYGFRPEGDQITAEGWQALFHPDEIVRLQREAERVFATHQDFEFQFRAIRPDGAVRWILSKGRVIHDRDGNAISLIGTHSDITERKSDEQELAKGMRRQAALAKLAEQLHRAKSLEDVYTAAFDTLFVALPCDRASILLCDEAGVMRFVGWRELSDEYRKLTDGHSPWKLGERNAQPVCVEEVRAAEMDPALKETVLREGIRALAFIPLVSQGRLIGKFMVYYNVPHAFSNEEIEVGLTIARQLAFGIESRRAEQTLRESEEQYRAIVESSDDAIISKDLQGVIASWNPAAERIFGYSAEEVIGRSITIIVPTELLDEEKQILSRLRAGERIEHYETVRRTKSGRTIEVSLTISPVRDALGRVVGASKIARDITERKRTEHALKEAELSGRLLQLQDEERRHIARELHDSVGQLLAALGMNVAAIAKERDKLSATATRSVDESGEMVEQVTAEIRTMSHLLHPPLLDEVGLNSALREYVDGFTERSKIQVELELPAKLERLPQDFELSLFRIVQECLTNIHRHSGSATAKLRLERTAGEIELEVRDEGKGIDTEIQEKFVTGQSSGVGLRGMRERVRQLGGSLHIHSLGKGTSVQVVLPLQRKGAAEKEKAAAGGAQLAKM